MYAIYVLYLSSYEYELHFQLTFALLHFTILNVSDGKAM